MLHVTCQHHLVSLEYLTLTKTALVDPHPPRYCKYSEETSII